MRSPKKKVKTSPMVLETGVSDGSSSKLFRCYSLDSGYSDFFKGSDLEYPDFLKEDWIQVYTKGAGYTEFSWKPYKALYLDDSHDTVIQNNQKVVVQSLWCVKYDPEKQIVVDQTPECFHLHFVRLSGWATIFQDAPAPQSPFEQTSSQKEPEKQQKGKKKVKKQSKKNKTSRKRKASKQKEQKKGEDSQKGKARKEKR